MIYDKEFYRKGHRGGDTVWSLRLDIEKGTLKVRSHKNVKDGPEIREMPPSTFMCGGNGYEHRACQAALRKLAASFERVEK